MSNSSRHLGAQQVLAGINLAGELMEVGISCTVFWHMSEGSQINAKQNAQSGKVS